MGRLQSLPANIYYKQDKPAKDKHSSLFGSFSTYKQEGFVNTDQDTESTLSTQGRYPVLLLLGPYNSWYAIGRILTFAINWILV